MTELAAILARRPMRVLNLIRYLRWLDAYTRRFVLRTVIPRLAKFTRVAPFQFGITSLWPGTYIAYVPDRYWSARQTYNERGGEFDCRYAKSFIRGNELNNAGDMPRYFGLSLICDQIVKEKITGDLAELGVYKGNTAVLLAALAKKLGSTAYLFDTYKGFVSEDLNGIDANKGAHFGDTSLDGVQSLVGLHNVCYVKGHFPGSTSVLADNLHFCLVHIDCDLYAPFAAALRYFYPRLVVGGFLIMHDYSNFFWDGAEKAVDEFFADKPEKLIPIPDKSGTVVIRKVAT
jgi:Macrocin-O-methyltransferase (TylF)